MSMFLLVIVKFSQCIYQLVTKNNGEISQFHGKYRFYLELGLPDFLSSNRDNDQLKKKERKQRKRGI